MTIFRLGHITDLHFSTREGWLCPGDGSNSPSDFGKRAYRHIVRADIRRSISDLFHPSGYSADAAQNLFHSLAKEAPSLDAVIITGDLATTGEAVDLQIAANFLGGTPPTWWNNRRGGIPSLIAQGVPVVTLPGNHDRYDGLFQPRSRKFEKFFGMYWDMDIAEISFSPNPILSETGRVRYTTLERDGVVLGVVMADLSLDDAHSGSGLGGFIGQGRAAAKILEEMIQSTKIIRLGTESERMQSAVIWAVHFPPEFPGLDLELALLQGQDLVEAADQSGVSVLLAGHTHESISYTAVSSGGHELNIICSGPSCGMSEHGNFSYSILEINADGTTITVNPIHYKWIDWKFRQQDYFPVSVI